MRIVLSILSVLVLAGIVSAADSTAAVAPAPPATQAVEPAPAPAPAPEATPAPAPASAEKPAQAACPAKCAPAAPPVTWYGLAMFRLRDEITTNYPNTGANAGKRLEQAAYSNQIAYKLGVKAKPNDQTLLQFEIGNDWYATEEVEGIPGNYWTKRNPMTPWFDLAYAQWDPGFLHIQAGIIPVKGTALMDLLGVSLFLNRTYKMAAHIPWGVVTNFSQTGLRLGAPILKGPVCLGVDAMSFIIEQRPVYAIGVDSLKVNASAVEFGLDVPLTVAGMNLTPQAFVIPNRSFNKANAHSEIEFGAGLDLGYKLNDGVTLRAGYGYARNSNKSSASATNAVYDIYNDPFNMLTKPDTVNRTIDSVKFDRWGNNVNVGTTVKLGPGKFDFDFNISNEQNAFNKNIDDWYPFFDIKYGWALSKNFILMPRVRLFFTEPKVGFNNECKTRPELIFAGTF